MHTNARGGASHQVLNVLFMVRQRRALLRARRALDETCRALNERGRAPDDLGARARTT